MKFKIISFKQSFIYKIINQISITNALNKVFNNLNYLNGVLKNLKFK